MQSRGRVSPPVQWVLALSVVTTLLSMALPARSGVLDPLAFTSLGSLNLGAGSIVINTDTVTITGAATFTGVLHDQGSFIQNGVTDYGRQVAVFDFNNINILAGVTISLTGSRPLALLSRGNLTITDTLIVNGASAAGTLGGAGGVGGAAGGQGGLIGSFGTGPGRGSTSAGGDNRDGGGGAFGGNAGAGGVLSVAGTAYGDLLNLLQGGSSGSGAADTEFANSGGGGGSGGGIELGSIGPVTLTGGLAANGGAGAVGAYYGGGGSGGGVVLHGSAISLGAALTAVGGSGGFAGGGGGGGRVAIAPDSLSVTQLHSLLGSISVNGGTANLSGRRGRAGVVSIRPLFTSVGAGQSLTFNTMATGQTGQLDPRINIHVRDLTIASGGSATANTAGAIASNGILAIHGTLLLGSNNQSVAILNGSGRVQIGPGASLTIGNGNLPSVFSGTFDGGGSVVKTGTGEFTLTGNARVNATLTLNSGSLTFSSANATIGSTIINSAARPITIWNNSTATFGAGLVTTGAVTVAGGSRAIFNSTFNTSTGTSGAGSVQINGTLVAGTGAASIGFGGNVGFGSLSSTRIDIGGVTPGTQHDFVDIAGNAALGGELRVGLIDGFLPSPGDTFQIMGFGSNTGDVTVLGAPGSAGLGLTKNYTATGLSVTINPLLMADTNYDGIVNRADLGRMALAWHTAGDWTDGDFNFDNRVDVHDLLLLALNWKNALPAASLGEALDDFGLPPIHIPEPTSSWAMLALLVGVLRKRARRQPAA